MVNDFYGGCNMLDFDMCDSGCNYNDLPDVQSFEELGPSDDPEDWHAIMLKYVKNPMNLVMAADTGIYKEKLGKGGYEKYSEWFDKLGAVFGLESGIVGGYWRIAARFAFDTYRLDSLMLKGINFTIDTYVYQGIKYTANWITFTFKEGDKKVKLPMIEDVRYAEYKKEMGL